MKTQPRTIASLRRFVSSMALPTVALLLGSTIALAQPQETAATQSTQPTTSSAATGYHPGVPTADDIRRARIERLARMDALGGQTVQSTVARDQGATRSLRTSGERQAILRSLDTMDVRLDHAKGILDAATGAQRGNEVMAVLQELTIQLAQMRQLVLAPNSARMFDDGVGAQAIFITPSSAERRENWRRQQLGQAAAYHGYAQASTSGLDAQAESRRGGGSP